jgi:hypothetical protein
VTGTPLDDLEQAKAMEDIGRTASLIYRGAKDEIDASAGSFADAFWAAVAAIIAILNAPPKEDE